jgi:hypothetical protein
LKKELKDCLRTGGMMGYKTNRINVSINVSTKLGVILA